MSLLTLPERVAILVVVVMAEVVVVVGDVVVVKFEI